MRLLARARGQSACQQRCAPDKGGEGRKLQRSFHPCGKVLAEDDEAGGDRDGVRRQRGKTGAGERVAVLEGALEDARAERVTGDQREGGEDPGAAVDDELGGDVAAREEEPRGEAERRATRQSGSE